VICSRRASSTTRWARSCVSGSATGAGGANVWNYGELKQALTGSRPFAADASGRHRPELLPSVAPPRAGQRGPAHRRRRRRGHAVRDDAQRSAQQQRRSHREVHRRAQTAAVLALTATVDAATRTIQVSTSGVDRLDTLVDGHPASTHANRGQRDGDRVLSDGHHARGPDGLLR
jgi:hypothetical protein